jgi:hypothetical protein
VTPESSGEYKTKVERSRSKTPGALLDLPSSTGRGLRDDARRCRPAEWDGDAARCRTSISGLDTAAIKKCHSWLAEHCII